MADDFVSELMQSQMARFCKSNCYVSEQLRARIAELEADLTARREAHETALRIMQGLTAERDEARRIGTDLAGRAHGTTLTTLTERETIGSWREDQR